MPRNYMKGKKSLIETHPKVANQWHPHKNDLSPKDVSSGSHKKVWWVCDVGHEWVAAVGKRTVGKGCPFCANKNVSTENCLATTHSEITQQWHCQKNGELTPDLIVAGSNKVVWWQCSVASDHEWKSSVCHRVAGRGCPCCSGHKVVESTSFLVTHPQLVKQWHDKNEIRPESVSAGSGVKVWWQCLINELHIWRAAVGDRVRGNGCPFCKESKGELRIAKFLDSNGTIYRREVRFESCRNCRPLPFDFAIYPLKLIEFQGLQHYKPTGFGGNGIEVLKRVCYNDSLKRQWCQENEISLLEIAYWDFDKIEKLVGEFICHMK